MPVPLFHLELVSSLRASLRSPRWRASQYESRPCACSSARPTRLPYGSRQRVLALKFEHHRDSYRTLVQKIERILRGLQLELQ